MIVNDFNKKVNRAGFSTVITIEDDGDNPVYVFPKTMGFIAEIQNKKNAEKLHQILRRV